MDRSYLTNNTGGGFNDLTFRNRASSDQCSDQDSSNHMSMQSESSISNIDDVEVHTATDFTGVELKQLQLLLTFNRKNEIIEHM